MAAAQETERLRAKPDRLAQVPPDIHIACLPLRIQTQVLAQKSGSDQLSIPVIQIRADERARAEIHDLQ